MVVLEEAVDHLEDLFEEIATDAVEFFSGWSQDLAGEASCRVDIGLVGLDVIQWGASRWGEGLDCFCHLPQQCDGLDQAEEFGLVPAALKPVILVIDVDGLGDQDGEGLELSLEEVVCSD
jgi:hypothetical protein